MIEVSKKELMKLSHKDNVRFALFCCYQIKEIWENKPLDIKCIELVELWLENKASRPECLAECLAATHAYGPVVAPICAIYTAAASTSYAAYAYSAADTTNRCYSSKTRANLIKEQRRYYNELLYIDDIFEKVVLRGVI